VIERGHQAHAEWTKGFDAWAGANADRKALFDRMASRTLPDGWAAALPEFKPDAKGVATRKASGEVLSALAKPLPELWGGSADLAGSNDTTMKGEPSFLPHERESKMFPGNKYGRTLHFGIREHGMGAILNGLAENGFKPFGATFEIFSDYMRPSIRLAALSELGVQQVVLPTKGKPNAARRAVENKEAFQELVRWRTGSEGRISCLKRDFGWNRTRIDGLEGAKTWCGHGVFNHNLVKVAALAVAK